VGCYIWYSEEEPGWAVAPSSTLLAVPNVTAHPPAASVPITVLLYDGPLLCGFTVVTKGLNEEDDKDERFQEDLRVMGISSSNKHIRAVASNRVRQRYLITQFLLAAGVTNS